MTEFSYPWSGTSVGDAGAYSDAQWATMWEEYNKNANETDDNAIGYLPSTGASGKTPLEITETSPTSLGVAIDVGSYIFFGRYYNNDASTTISVDNNLSGNDRIDALILECDWSAQTIRLNLIKGTPAGSPVAPTLTQTKGTLWQHKLAEITVQNGASSIVNSDIDTSFNKPLKPVTNNYKSVSAGDATSTFASQWSNQEIETNDIAIVEYDDNSASFLSFDEGSNWYRINGEYTNTTHATQTADFRGTNYTVVGTPITVTAEKNHVFVNIWGKWYADVGGGNGGINDPACQGEILVNSTVVFELEAGWTGNTGNDADGDMKALTLSGRIPCDEGDTVTIQFKLRQQDTAGAFSRITFGGTTSV